MSTAFQIADLFCGAGGTSTGALRAAREAGLRPSLTAVNHWPRAIETHTANHPEARHLCTSIDAIDPRSLFKLGELDLLLASPECMHHSVARGGRPVNDQSRATAWCVTRWAEALQPGAILVENVPEFLDWAPIGTNGRPLKSQRGAVFQGWVAALRALGYSVDWRILCAADYGDPTSRRRLFVQAVRGRRKIRWPERTHGATGADSFPVKPYRTAREVINWHHPSRSIYDPKRRPLSPNTLRRIEIGLRRYGLGAFLVPQQSRHETRSVDRPLQTVTGTATGEGLAQPYLVKLRGTSEDQIEKHSGQSVDVPLPTITAGGGHIGLCEPFLTPFYGSSGAVSVDEPLDTVTCKDRFGLVQPRLLIDGEEYLLDVHFRMLQPDELSRAQGFPDDYRFAGTKTEIVKQIGNAVPCGLARALVSAVIGKEGR